MESASPERRAFSSALTVTGTAIDERKRKGLAENRMPLCRAAWDASLISLRVQGMKASASDAARDTRSATLLPKGLSQFSRTVISSRGEIPAESHMAEANIVMSLELAKSEGNHALSVAAPPKAALPYGKPKMAGASAMIKTGQALKKPDHLIPSSLPQMMMSMKTGSASIAGAARRTICNPR